MDPKMNVFVTITANELYKSNKLVACRLMKMSAYRLARPLAYIFLQFQIMNLLPQNLLRTYDTCYI